ncbi:hypothetical protein [Nonomuraea angiospora]|uniref:hypothetical protein n=1 Tax=Nonomuraea angiospora TaxID=46172 RepID=UPI0029B50CA5|nr:hypothetical protein [Nonomuraea angiospora]MDX3101648.1 hypothetical protein [Nonomuraea angiospora]
MSIMQPLKLHQLRQPPPLHQHRPNGAPAPVGDTLVVAANAKAIGAVITVDMADSFDGFPYWWTNWNDWYSRIDKMIAAVKARPDITNIDAWEPWNEPDWTWPSASGVPFNEGWVRTYQRIRQSEPNQAIMGPSYSRWDVNWMRSFLGNAKATGTLPQVVSWHELSGWQQVTGNVRAYRALERELGISPRPISINEYAMPSEIDVPSSANHYVAQFEREGVRDAERAFWYEWGTLNGLLHNGRPTASYWMYKWYADQTGNIVKVTPTTSNDGVAAYDPGSRTFSLVFGGQSGDNSIRVDGIGAGLLRDRHPRVRAGLGTHHRRVRGDHAVVEPLHRHRREPHRPGRQPERQRRLPPDDHPEVTGAALETGRRLADERQAGGGPPLSRTMSSGSFQAGKDSAASGCSRPKHARPRLAAQDGGHRAVRQQGTHREVSGAGSPAAAQTSSSAVMPGQTAPACATAF